jgi:multidrug transporter EmrE-like cation transporter
LTAFIAAGITQVTTNLPSYFKDAGAINPVVRTIWFQMGIAAGFAVLWLFKRKTIAFTGVLKPSVMLGILYILLYFVLMFKGLDKLAAAGAGSVGFPVMLGSCIVGFFLYSLIFLKEKATPTGVAGFLLCLAGIITLSL